MKIRLEHIKKDFGDGPLFDPFDAEFYSDQVYIIHGVSGCGKSTLLSLIGLIDRPNEGAIYYDDNDFASASNEKRNEFRRKNISFFFQGGNLLNELSLEDNLACVCSSKEEIDQTLKHFKLDDIQHQHAIYCSRGEQQRAGICRTMLENKPIVLFDEPTASLDPENRKIFYDSLAEFRKGRIVFIVSHKYKTEEDSPFIHHLYFEDGTIECPETMKSNEASKFEVVEKKKDYRTLKKRILSKEFSKGALFGLIYLATSSFFGYVAGTAATYIPLTPNGTRSLIMERFQTKTLPFTDPGHVPEGIVYRSIDIKDIYSVTQFQLFYTNDPAIEKNEKETGRIIVSSAMHASLSGAPLTLFDTSFPVEKEEGIPLISKQGKYALISTSLLSSTDPKISQEIDITTMGDLYRPLLYAGTTVSIDRSKSDSRLKKGEISISIPEGLAMGEDAIFAAKGKTFQTTPSQGSRSRIQMGRFFDEYTLKEVDYHPASSSIQLLIRFSEEDNLRFESDLLRYFPYEGTDAYFRYILDCPAKEIKADDVFKFWSVEGSQLRAFENYLTAYNNILIPVFTISSLFAIGLSLLYILNICKMLNANVQLAEAIGWNTTPFFLSLFLLCGIATSLPFAGFSFLGFGKNILPSLGFFGNALATWVGSGVLPWPAPLIVIGQLLVGGAVLLQERKAVASRLASSIKISRELEDEGI